MEQRVGLSDEVVVRELSTGRERHLTIIRATREWRPVGFERNELGERKIVARKVDTYEVEPERGIISNESRIGKMLLGKPLGYRGRNFEIVKIINNAAVRG